MSDGTLREALALIVDPPTPTLSPEYETREEVVADADGWDRAIRYVRDAMDACPDVPMGSVVVECPPDRQALWLLIGDGTVQTIHDSVTWGAYDSWSPVQRQVWATRLHAVAALMDLPAVPDA